MMRSLFAGVSGLRNHQTRMDVIGNNIANVNTTSFKSSRVTFAESFNQVVQGARRPPDDAGGQNPVQIGNGMQVASIDQKFTQGTIESTGVTTDVAIQGDGFFVVRGNGRTQYTRAGNFQFDALSRLVSPANGFIVQGINADTAGNFSAASQITDIDLSGNLKSPARATTRVSIVGNLNRNQPLLNPMPGTPPAPANSRAQAHQMGITVYDSLGQAHNLQMTIQQQWTTGTPPVPDPSNTWRWSLASTTAAVQTIDQSPTGGTPAAINNFQGTIRFNDSGQLIDFTNGNGTTSITGGDVRIRLTPNGSTQSVDIALDPGNLSDINGFSQFANPSNAVFANQDGFTAGDLTSISIDSTGTITGFYTNGVSRPVAQIALARFNNPSGLLRRGANMYEPSANSGLGILGFAGTSNTSSITASALEGSNVDISEEFTNMIVTQRGFQANARVITTSDEMLTELVNLRR